MHNIRMMKLRYLYGGLVHYRPGERLAPRTLPDYEVVWIIEGQVQYQLDGVTHAAPPGSVILARPGFKERYLWDPHHVTRHAYFHFDLEAWPDDWPALETWPVLQQNPDPVIPALIRHVVERLAAHPEWPALVPGPDEHRLVECLLSVLVRPAGKGRWAGREFPPPVHQALNFMREVLDEHPHQRVTLGALATRSGVTDKHLCRLFQQALGHSPMHTFRLMKLQLAVALLGRSNLAIQQIADRCGFENPLYFSRLFAKTYGVPPSEVRKALRRQEPPPASLLPPEITPRLYW